MIRRDPVQNLDKTFRVVLRVFGKMGRSHDEVNAGRKAIAIVGYPDGNRPVYLHHLLSPEKRTGDIHV